MEPGRPRPQAVADRHLRQKEHDVFIAIALASLAASALVGLPGDWARRRSPANAALAQTANIVTLVCAIVAAASLGIASGLGAAIAILIGVAVGQTVADRAATSLWGPAA